ncbi:hypothetical protein L228DRAFT_246246 [Xylona heveae TC161]|uniref:Mitochondrial K+-H+ exchange-related-domain-containing protein n=1 Tax=Xylona heveae (strain CBS 132557 / TC161) TaxID=1328760 RepID=A0A165HGF2_XYLHT|nr:hypothetical protein L228DRAFT_246246 [Xylona heveae TC161]KZF23474.1 hypothetical protein L228DRAFT_246246 [Xylona heveae TC161]
MRLHLLPISTRRSLIYCQRLNRHVSPDQTYLDRVTHKASEVWLKWERAEKGWKKSVTEYGNRAMQQIPYEEWGLKSVPPLSARRRDQELKGTRTVDVTFPSSIIPDEKVSDILRTLSTERQSLHRKRMWWSIFWMPFTAPVALIPIIPNIPFFYLCFRAWSHWRALSGSKHVEFLLDNNLIKHVPSSLLDARYRLSQARKQHSTATTSGQDKITYLGNAESDISSSAGEILLLHKSDGKLLAAELEFPELQLEVERAVWQVNRAIKGKKELKNEKDHLHDATKPEGKDVRPDDKKSR